MRVITASEVTITVAYSNALNAENTIALAHGTV
ncbi:hypothetical protein J2Y41_004705 [Arthrobacter sp. 1088]|nr:hypothetical protein [Arthrobacter sp. 1088]